YQMIGLFDERGIQYANWQFDGAGRAISSERGSPGSGINKVSLAYTSTTSTMITNPLGNSRTITLSNVNHAKKVTGMSVACPSCGSNAAAKTYDANGNVDTETDFDGTITDVDYNTRGLLTQKIESANKTATKRTTQVDWHASFNVPIERRIYNNANGTNVLETKTKYAYNSRGQVTAVCQINPSVSAAMSYVCGSSTNAPTGVRQSTTTYCEQADITASNCPLVGLVTSSNGPRTDASDVTMFIYYQTDDATCAASPTTCPHRKGDLWKITNAALHVTEYLAYDGTGHALKTKDANNVITDMEYNPRGWLTAYKVRGLDDTGEFYDDAISRYDYDAAGQVIKATQADGHLLGDYIIFNYDAAHRLTDIVDAENNSITYTLDHAGNRTV
ncbi:MAG: type IV secretion protein Rhs, partial [Arenimonas sp.]